MGKKFFSTETRNLVKVGFGFGIGRITRNQTKLGFVRNPKPETNRILQINPFCIGSGRSTEYRGLARNQLKTCPISRFPKFVFFKLIFSIWISCSALRCAALQPEILPLQALQHFIFSLQRAALRCFGEIQYEKDQKLKEFVFFSLFH